MNEEQGMNLLFISMSARIIYDDKENVYLNSHMNRKSIQKYSKLCKNFRMILRDSGIRCSETEAKEKYNPFPKDIAELYVGYNPFLPKKNLINIKAYRQLKTVMETNIRWADKVIMASATGLYTNIAIKYCKKYSKEYMLLVGGFAFETDWNHGLEGKMFSFKHEIDCKRNLLAAPYAVYVTQNALQKRYPCRGKTLGCSDVEIMSLNRSILYNRSEKINSQPKQIVIGTAAGLDIKLKGQKHVIEALALLKKEGYTNFVYQLLGAGSGNVLKKYAKDQGVLEQVMFMGTKPHDEVYFWLDSIDIYIQPSYIEGLCRAVVEAMSRACPIICTDVGGNVELCNEEYLIRPKNAEDIKNALLKLLDKKSQWKEAQESFRRVQKFNDTLNLKRDEFFISFVENRC